LPPHRQCWVLGVEQRFCVRVAHLPNLLAKKSFSILNSPIFACSRSISRAVRASALGLVPKLDVKGTGSLLLQLLLLRINLVRVNLVSLGEVRHCRLFP
jgi:hypothetical protein